MSDTKNTPDKDPDLAELFGDAPAASTSILTEEEISSAKKVAAENVRKALRDAELKRIVAEEEVRLRRLEGQRTGVADKDEEVTLMIDLAEISACISINNVEYHHGYSYTVPRHVADTLREIMQRAARHVMEIDGKSHEEAYRRTRPMELTPSGERPLREGIAA